MKKQQLLILRGLLAHKIQFTALSIIVLLGTALFVTMVTAFDNLDESYQHTYAELRFADYTGRRAGRAPGNRRGRAPAR